MLHLSNPNRRRARFQARIPVCRQLGFTLIELIVVIAIIGILVGLLLPAVQRARESMRMMSCRNNLHQISLATELFHESFRYYPPGRYQPRPGEGPPFDCGGDQTTWLARILPYLEQAAAEEKWDYTMAYADHPKDVRESTFPVYTCPSRRSVSEAVGQGISASTGTVVKLACGCSVSIPTSTSVTVSGAVGDYGGNHGDLSPGTSGLPTDLYYGGNGTGVIISSRAMCKGTSPVNWIDHVNHASVTDGLSSTFLVGEMHVPITGLGQAPQDAFIYNGDSIFNFSRIGGPTAAIVSDIRDSVNGLSSWGSYHPGVCQFAFCDGSVRAIANSIDTEVLGNLCNRHDTQRVTFD